MTAVTDDVDPRNPARRADLSVFPLDEDLVVYDPETGESFVLNQTGKLVWEQCNGEHCAEDIAAEIAAMFDIPAGQAIADVTELLNSFEQANLLLARS